MPFNKVNKLKYIVLFFCFVATRPLLAQNENDRSDFIQQIIENIAAESEDELDYSILAEELEYLYENPLNINSATSEELDKLVMLNDFQIQSLLAYRKKYKKLLTLYELKNIEGFNSRTVSMLLPFVYLSNKEETEKWKLKNALKYGRNDLFFRFTTLLENQAGYEKVSDSIRQAKPNKYYLGSKHRVYSRYRFNYKNKLQWGITAEKDPGEQFFRGNQKYGFDFYSAHLLIKDVGIVKTLVIGDYQAMLGQGLIMWSYMSMGKSAYIMDVRKKTQGLNKYSSADENSFLRGVGATLDFKNISFTAFGSYKKVDANISPADTLTQEEAFFSSFDNTGIHATPNQIAKKDALTEALVGANVSWNAKKFKVGISGVGLKYDLPLVKNDKPYNRYTFQDDKNYNLSADFQFMFKSLYFFGEAGISKSGGKAVVAGALMKFAERINGSILYRNFSRNFQTNYGNAFREGGRVENEEGLYLGLEIHPIRKVKITGYYDFFKFPWLKIYSDAPSMGYDFLVRTDYKPTRNLSMYLQFKKKEKQRNNTIETARIPELIPEKKLSTRYHLAYRINQQWYLQSRIEISKYQKNTEKSEYGYSIYQDVSCSPFEKLPFKITVRYSIFETDSYHARIYAYESDVLYAYSIPSVYYKGTRWYALFNYKLGKHLDFWLRYHQTWYANKNKISTGLNQINGNTRTEVKFQIRYKF